jgi:hypothetical protein
MSLFYIDSYRADEWTLIAPTNYNSVALETLMSAYPNILLSPEAAWMSNPTSTYPISSWWGVTTPFLMPSYSGYFTPTSISSLYPRAFSLIYMTTTGYTNLQSMIQSVQAGNILLVNSWYSNAFNNLANKAYLAAESSLNAPSDLHVVTNNVR